MGKLIHEIANQRDNLKHNFQFVWKTKVRQPWNSKFSRQYSLDSWHLKQKRKFKELFELTFAEEQRDNLPKARLQRQLELEAEGVDDKLIKKQIAKLKVEKFNPDISKVTVVLYLKKVFDFVDQEREKSAQLKIGKKDDSLIFIRNTNTSVSSTPTTSSPSRTRPSKSPGPNSRPTCSTTTSTTARRSWMPLGARRRSSS